MNKSTNFFTNAPLYPKNAKTRTVLRHVFGAKTMLPGKPVNIGFRGSRELRKNMCLVF